MSQGDVGYRPATSTDAPGIADLHAQSWRAHYRGAYSDAFLDNEVLTDRVAVWTERLRAAQADEYTLVAESKERIVGFAHTILGEDARWGALLENLHVDRSLHRRGVGTELIARTAHVVLERAPSQGLHLWVLEQNAAGQAFYHALGGTRVERAPAVAPGGDPARLTGRPWRFRFAWDDPGLLLEKAQGGRVEE